ncbi:hypothetical protein CJ195_18135 [Bacillus sp. UMB0899]|nr:hypothetical protein CJ195_18135 [Bacillus sp. UMB0899]
MIFTVWFLLEWKENEFFQDPDYVAILIAIGWIIFLFYWFKKRYFTWINSRYIVQGSFILIALASGWYGFWKYAYIDDSHSLLNALYSTIRLFFIDVDPVSNNPGNNKYADLPFAIDLARWTAAISTIVAILSLFWGYFTIVWKEIMLRFQKDHVLVFGYNKKSSTLINNLREENYKLIVVSHELDAKDIDELNKKRITYIENKDVDEIFLKKISLIQAKHVLLLNDDDSINLDHYINIRDYVNDPKNNFKNQRISEEKLMVFLHLNHAKSEQVYQALIKEEGEHIQSNAFSAYRLVAEKMVEENPLFLGYEKQLRNPDTSPLHLLFIGFGKANQQLAFHILNLTHFMTKKQIQITVFDKDIEKVKKEWGYLARRTDPFAHIDFQQVDLTNQVITEKLKEINKPITHVYLSLKNDFLDMIEGIELIDILPDVPIFIKMKDDRSISNWLDHSDKFANVKRYAYFREVLTSDYVLKLRLNKTAKAAHEKYRERRKELNLEEGKAWDELDAFKKESTRYQILHTDTKLMLMGLKKVSIHDTKYEKYVLSETAYQEHIKPHVEPLAQIEKQRWNAFHYIRGWKYAGETDASKEELEDQKLHRYLVQWEDLEDEIKEYDRDSIRHLRIYYQSQDFGLIKEEDLTKSE